jgi:hypothetical protein
MAKEIADVIAAITPVITVETDTATIYIVDSTGFSQTGVYVIEDDHFRPLTGLVSLDAKGVITHYKETVGYTLRYAAWWRRRPPPPMRSLPAIDCWYFLRHRYKLGRLERAINIGLAEAQPNAYTDFVIWMHAEQIYYLRVTPWYPAVVSLSDELGFPVTCREDWFYVAKRLEAKTPYLAEIRAVSLKFH